MENTELKFGQASEQSEPVSGKTMVITEEAIKPVKYRREYKVTVPEDVTSEMLESWDNANRLANSADEAGIEWWAWNSDNEFMSLTRMEYDDVEFSQRSDAPEDSPCGAKEVRHLTEVQFPGIEDA